MRVSVDRVIIVSEKMQDKIILLISFNLKIKIIIPLCSAEYYDKSKRFLRFFRFTIFLS